MDIQPVCNAGIGDRKMNPTRPKSISAPDGYLCWMVTQNILRTHKGKQVFSEKKKKIDCLLLSV